MTTYALSRFRRNKSLVVFLLLFLFSPAATAAQLISVKTQSIADANQFSFFPSLTAGMGGVSIALPDSLHDPFVNPAAGARVARPLFFSAPTFFSVTANAGSGTTFPLGMITRSGKSFGGAAVAIQSIANASPLGVNQFLGGFEGQPLDNDDPDRANRYGFVLFGHTLERARITLGASAFVSDLGAIDGTALMYPDSRRVQQSGRAADVRVGLLKEWNGGAALEALVFDRQVGVTHNVTYGDLYWDAINRSTVMIDRTNRERDRTHTVGLHLEYARPLGDSGWRAGFVFTANRITNPNRPAYDIEAIPGDHGRASALNVGVGVARSLGRTTLAADAIYEPIWSRIWLLNDSSNAALDPNERTMDNRLRFSNALMRLGMSHDLTASSAETKVQMQLGLQAHSIHYAFDQDDLIAQSTRRGSRNWMEWTRTWGLSLRRANVILGYSGRHLVGASRPGVENNFAIPGGPITADFIARPATIATPIVLRDVTVITHQLSMSLAVR